MYALLCSIPLEIYGLIAKDVNILFLPCEQKFSALGKGIKK